MEKENKYFCRDNKNKGCRLYFEKIVSFPLCEFCDYSDKIEDDCIPDNIKVYSAKSPLGQVISERIFSNKLISKQEVSN